MSGDEFRQRRAGVQGLLGVRSGTEHQRAAHADPLLQGLDAGVLRRESCRRLPACWWRSRRCQRLRSPAIAWATGQGYRRPRRRSVRFGLACPARPFPSRTGLFPTETMSRCPLRSASANWSFVGRLGGIECFRGKRRVLRRATPARACWLHGRSGRRAGLSFPLREAPGTAPARRTSSSGRRCRSGWRGRGRSRGLLPPRRVTSIGVQSPTL